MKKIVLIGILFIVSNCSKEEIKQVSIIDSMEGKYTCISRIDSKYFKDGRIDTEFTSVEKVFRSIVKNNDSVFTINYFLDSFSTIQNQAKYYIKNDSFYKVLTYKNQFFRGKFFIDSFNYFVMDSIFLALIVKDYCICKKVKS